MNDRPSEPATCPRCRTSEERTDSEFCRKCGGPLLRPGVDDALLVHADVLARKDTLFEEGPSAEALVAEAPPKPAPTIPEPRVYPQGTAVVRRVLELSAPAPLSRRVVAIAWRALLAALASGVVLFVLGWLRRLYGKSIAGSLSIRSNGVNMQVGIAVLALVLCALLSVAIFKATSRRWVRVR